jgi:hypothetical protein
MIWINPDVVAAILVITGLTSVLYGILTMHKGG